MTQSRPALLFSQMEPPPALDDQFHDWYDREHVPARLRLPGFTAARRYVARDGIPKYLAVYELVDLSVLDSPGYRALKDAPSPLTARMLSAVEGFTRFTCVLQSDTGPVPPSAWLSVVAFQVAEDDRREFDDWYKTEHVPLLMGEPDWLRVRRYEVTSGEGEAWTHMALHELRSAAAMTSPARAAARRGSKRAALASRPWFSRGGRWLYESLAPASGDGSRATAASGFAATGEEEPE